VALLDQQIAAHEDALGTATEERDAALQQQSVTDTTPTPVFSAEGQSVVRKTRVVKTAAAAVVAGFPIAIGVVLLLDAAQRRRARRPARPDRDDALAGSADDELELEAAPTSPVSPSPALIGATPGPAGLPAGSAAAVTHDDIEDDVDEDDVDEYDDYEDEVDEDEAGELDEVDEDEAAVVEAVIVEEDVEDDLEDIDDELEDDLDEDLEEVDEADEAVHDAEVLHELDEEELEEAELDEVDEHEVELDEAELDELALSELDDGELEDDLDEADLGDDLDDELEDDVAATVASRRRLYDADIDDDLSVDGGPGEHNGPEQNGPQHNGLGRVWARVPAADADFDGDDEAGADR
jgi:hypothetical protein